MLPDFWGSDYDYDAAHDGWDLPNAEPCEDCGELTMLRMSALTNSGRVIWVPVCASCQLEDER